MKEIKTVGLIGLGDIAQATARVLRAFGCNVYYYAPHRRSPSAEMAMSVSYLPLEKLIELIQEAVGGTSSYWAGLIADHLLQNGVTVRVGTPLENLDLSLRAYNALRRAGINTVEELRKIDDSEIEQLRGVGTKIAYEILRVRDGGA